MLIPDDEIKMLTARLDDLARRAEKGVIAYSKFLSPREKHYAEMFLRERGLEEQSFFFGGAPGAVRTRLFLTPDYLAGLDKAGMVESCREEIRGAVSAIIIKDKGFGKRPLTHRDFLGACLGLGLSRDAIGDICVSDDGAVMFCDGTISCFLSENLTSVGSQSVSVGEFIPDEDFEIKQEFSHISGTVASARIDCVIAELTNLSREKSQSMINSGLVEVEYETCEKNDRVFDAPFTVSVRGYGKYIVRALDEKTRKGRLRLDADKYI